MFQIHRRTIIIAVTATAVSAVGFASGTIAVGEESPSRSETAKAATERFASFARPQEARDVFDSQSPAAENQRAAAEIAKTSRRVHSDTSGEAFVFQNGEREICILWRPSTRDVAGSACGGVDSDPPSVRVGNVNSPKTPVVAGVVPKDVKSVDVANPDGTRLVVPVREGAYVYDGPAPYRISWKSSDGSSFDREIRPTSLPTERAQP
jgi:hypothetical protein